MNSESDLDRAIITAFEAEYPDSHASYTESLEKNPGVPDLSICMYGTEFWVESKYFKHRKPNIRPTQVKWVEKRTRAGGLVVIATYYNGDLLLNNGYYARTMAARGFDYWMDTGEIVKAVSAKDILKFVKSISPGSR